MPGTTIFTDQKQAFALQYLDASGNVTTAPAGAGTPVYSLVSDDGASVLDKGLITLSASGDGLSGMITATGANVGTQTVKATVAVTGQPDLTGSFVATISAAGGFTPPPGPAVSLGFSFSQPVAK